jgi:hypothetical protein
MADATLCMIVIELQDLVFFLPLEFYVPAQWE